MNRCRAHIIPSILLGILLLFGNAPKEFIHLFASHKDTVHCAHQDGELSFEPEHHHCDFLSYALPPFLNAALPQIHFSTEKPVYQLYNGDATPILFEQERLIALLRGPPELC